MNKYKELAKKRMMFIQNEDYNFLTYNLLLLLNELDCTSELKKFNDFRRIAYLIEFISNDINIEDYSEIELSNIYIRSQLKKKLLSHLIITLKHKKYLGIFLNETHKTLDIWIYKENIPSDFFDKKYFDKEIKNIKNIKKYAKIRINQKLKSLVDNLYTDRGVQTWEV